MLEVDTDVLICRRNARALRAFPLNTPRLNEPRTRGASVGEPYRTPRRCTFVTTLTLVSALPLAAHSAAQSRSAARIAALEVRAGGRLGGLRPGYRERSDDRLSGLGTLSDVLHVQKLLATGAVLARVDRGFERLHRRITYRPATCWITRRSPPSTSAAAG
jgi:hypothetical protein